MLSSHPRYNELTALIKRPREGGELTYLISILKSPVKRYQDDIKSYVAKLDQKPDLIPSILKLPLRTKFKKTDTQMPNEFSIEELVLRLAFRIQVKGRLLITDANTANSILLDGILKSLSNKQFRKLNKSIRKKIKNEDILIQFHIIASNVKVDTKLAGFEPKKNYLKMKLSEHVNLRKLTKKKAAEKSIPQPDAAEVQPLISTEAPNEIIVEQTNETHSDTTPNYSIDSPLQVFYRLLYQNSYGEATLLLLNNVDLIKAEMLNLPLLTQNLNSLSSPIHLYSLDQLCLRLIVLPKESPIETLKSNLTPILELLDEDLSKRLRSQLKNYVYTLAFIKSYYKQVMGMDFELNENDIPKFKKNILDLFNIASAIHTATSTSETFTQGNATTSTERRVRQGDTSSANNDKNFSPLSKINTALINRDQRLKFILLATWTENEELLSELKKYQQYFLIMPAKKNIVSTQFTIEELLLNLYLIKSSNFFTSPENSIFHLLIDKRIFEVLDILTFDEVMLVKLSLDAKKNKFIQAHANNKLELTIEDTVLADLISNLHALLFHYMNNREDAATIRMAELIHPHYVHDTPETDSNFVMETFVSNLDSCIDDAITGAIDELQNEELARSSTFSSRRRTSFSIFSPPEQMSDDSELTPLLNENAEKQQP